MPNFLNNQIVLRRYFYNSKRETKSSKFFNKNTKKVTLFCYVIEMIFESYFNIHRKVKYLQGKNVII